MDGIENILLIGNGFDLAHGLPTKYSDFLEYYIQLNSTKYQERLMRYDSLPPEFELLWEITKKRIGGLGMVDGPTAKFVGYTKDNIWLDYFVELYIRRLSGENWIDFEREVSLIIQSFDSGNFHQEQALSSYRYMKDLNPLAAQKINLFIDVIWNKNQKKNVKNKFEPETLTIGAFREILFQELQNLICGLELYLIHVVEVCKVAPIEQIQDINPFYVISFNYTHTAAKIFEEAEVTYIHGECSDASTIDTNNMIIGIDDYGRSEDDYTDYAVFKKYVQRIQKRTDKGKLDQLAFVYSTKYRLHIYGHSLDITDKDVLKDILMYTNIEQVIVYCMNKSAEGQYIANLVNIIGKQEVVSRYNSGALEFQFISKDGD